MTLETGGRLSDSVMNLALVAEWLELGFGIHMTVTGQLVDMPAHGLVSSWTGPLPDYAIR